MARFVVEEIYSEEYNLTFLVETSFENEEMKSREVVGMYKGTPDEEKTNKYYNSYKVEL